MRVAELFLERYGRFADYRMSFPKADRDFHLVYGPNEAGKTTTLAALSDLLFGFGGRIGRLQYWLIHLGALVIFGLFLVLTAVKMAVVKSEPDPSKNPIVRLVKKYMRLTEFYDGQKFFTKRTLPVEYTEVDGKKVALPAPPGTLSKAYAATPLLLALVLVEVTDLIFAVDSIPAIFAITPDPFIVFTSNIFAILGLRALYFCLAALIEKFRYLKPALILILAFVGAKLLLLSVPPYIDDVASWVGMTVEPMKAIKIDTIVSLGVVVGLLVLATVASILRPLPDSKTDSTKH